MNKKLQPTLLALTLAASFGANAVVYKIENIDELYKVNGTVSNYRTGTSVTLNNNDVYLGAASGAYSPTLSDEDLALINNNSVDVAIPALSTFNANSSSNPLRTAKVIPQSNNSIFQFDSELMPQEITIFEESIVRDQRLISTVDSFVFDISDSNIIVGTTSSAAFELPDPDQRTGNIDRDFPFYVYDYQQRAMVIENGRARTFVPDFSEYGGQSGLTAINENGFVVGYAGTSINAISQANIDELCLGTFADTEENQELDTGNLIVPLEVCTGGFSHDGGSNSAVQYNIEAYSWQYINGQLTDGESLGVLNADGASFAFDVNDIGIAVGQSTSNVVNLNVAVIFKDDEIIDLMDYTESTWRNSSVTSINNNNLAVGSMEKVIDGAIREKFFIYNVDSEENLITFPDDFATSETDLASVPSHINDNNQVVGSIEVDAEDASGRTTHGFLYNIDDNIFEDINDLLICESKGYEAVGSNWKKFEIQTVGGQEKLVSFEADIIIVNANKISDDGTIMATALVTLPSLKTQFVDEQGIVITSIDQITSETAEEIVVDAAGDPVFDTDASGDAITEQVLRSVILKPTTQGEACDLIGEDSTDFKQTREGASVGFMSLFALIGGLFIRRLRR